MSAVTLLVTVAAAAATHLDFKTLSFKYNDTFHPKHKTTESMDENNCTSSGRPLMKNNHHHHKKKEEKKTHLNLELSESISLGLGPS
ncbi:hypothetical protein ACOSP7_016897 [Xanthoceras sorbifolium]